MKEIIFIHIPKTGGLSIREALNLNKSSHYQVSHFTEKVRESKFIFAIVRNPFDRIVSAYNYLKLGGRTQYDESKGDMLPADFKSFVADIDKYINLGHFRPMSYWLDRDIDFIGRFENLQENFNIICSSIGIECQQLQQLNKFNHKHYMSYYDDNIKQVVAEKYAEDLDRFKYKFEG